MGYDESKMARAAAGSSDGGQWVSKDASRMSAGQLDAFGDFAEAAGDDFTAERMRMHATEESIKELAALGVDIRVREIQMDGKPVWELDGNMNPTAEGGNADAWEALRTAYEENEDVVAERLLSHLDAKTLGEVGTPFEYEEIKPYGGGWSKPMVERSTTLSAERLAARAAHEPWEIAPEQDALFADTSEPVEFEPTAQKLPMSELADDDEVGVVDTATGRALTAADFRGNAERSAQVGAWNTADNRYAYVEPWKQDMLTESGISPVSPGTNVYRSAELDEAIPFVPGSAADEEALASTDMFPRHREKSHPLARTPSDSLAMRTWLASGGERIEGVQAMAEKVEGARHLDNRTPDTMEPAQREAWMPEGLEPMRSKLAKGKLTTGYQLNPEVNALVPEHLRRDDGFYNFHEESIVRACVSTDEAEGRDAVIELHSLMPQDYLYQP